MTETEMYFHGGHEEYILFEPLRIYLFEHVIAASFGMGAVAVLYEGLKALRMYLLKRVFSKIGKDHEETPIADPSRKDLRRGILNSWYILQAFLYVVQVFISYCLMLVVMTFNVWLCLSIVVGAGIGNYLFGWISTSVGEAHGNRY